MTGGSLFVYARTVYVSASK